MKNPRPAIRDPQYYLATLHRAENTDDPSKLKSILKALAKIGKEIPVVLPLHPRTMKMIKTYHMMSETKGVKLIDPVSYFDMLKLEKSAKAILTDSGGVQKEAYWFKVPCFTLRDETEWVETVESGWNTLVGAAQKKIIQHVRRGIDTRPSGRRTALFGDGQSSHKIIQLLFKKLK